MAKSRTHEKLTLEVEITAPGYLLTTLSHDAPENVDVYFDDYTIIHEHGRIVQVQDYYPYGLPFNTKIREHEVLNTYLYQGKELLDSLGRYDFHARMYDPALGRFLGADPAGQFHSPYAGMGNNPVMMVDPDGEFVVLVAIGVGALVGYIGGRAAGLRGWDLAGYTLASGVISGLSAGIGSAVSSAVSGAFAAGANTIAVGAASGAAGGLAGGFVGGAASAALNGSSNPFGAGLKAGLIGGVSGGIFGALGGGFQNLSDSKNFWGTRYTGDGLTYEYTVDVTTGGIKKISNLGGANTHFYHIGRYVDDGAAFASNMIKVIDGANSINAFRFWQSATSTISAFSAPASGLTGYFLEPAGPSTTLRNQDRRVPAGRYNLTPNMNSYPDDYMIYNNSVPANRGITIHSGNGPDDTLGCLLPGCSWSKNWVSSSRIKRNALRAHINAAGYRNVRLNIFDVFR